MFASGERGLKSLTSVRRRQGKSKGAHGPLTVSVHVSRERRSLSIAARALVTRRTRVSVQSKMAPLLDHSTGRWTVDVTSGARG